MTLNGVMAVTLRYFTEFGKPAFQHITIGATTVGTGGYWSLNFLAVVFKKSKTFHVLGSRLISIVVTRM